MKCKDCIYYDPVYPIEFISKRGIVFVEFKKTCDELACEINPKEQACKRFKKKF